MQRFKIIVEEHSDGYVAYPLGFKGVVVGQGDTYEDALADVVLCTYIIRVVARCQGSFNDR